MVYSNSPKALWMLAKISLPKGITLKEMLYKLMQVYQDYWKNCPSQQLFKVFIYIYFAGSSNNLDKVHATGCRTTKYKSYILQEFFQNME
jgi:hypothetical protein